MTWTIHNGDCLEVLRTLADCSVDAVVTDPPYGLSFMGKRWDYDVPGVDVWAECLRVLKPGGHLLAFAGTRTQHRMAVRIEDAGFEIRDMIAWVYGSGFPKSLDVSKAIDKAAGAEREVVGLKDNKGRSPGNIASKGLNTDSSGDPITVPATEAARQWQGWGTALKPALEPISVARKPLIGTVAENVLTHGTGALNVDGCRVGTQDNLNGGFYRDSPDEYQAVCYGKHKRGGEFVQPSGRWPANLIHDGSEEVVGLFPESKDGVAVKRNGVTSCGPVSFGGIGVHPVGTPDVGYGGGGSAARFFYCAKASKADRDEGCGELEKKNNMRVNGPRESEEEKHATKLGNHHPTVKPTDLMRYLCRLVTPPGGTVLDPFTGSGSTGKAAILERFNFIGIEREAEYCEIARARISKAERDVSKELL